MINQDLVKENIDRQLLLKLQLAKNPCSLTQLSQGNLSSDELSKPLDTPSDLSIDTLNLTHGLYIVIGENGSGKSSLLKAILSLPSKLKIEAQLWIDHQEVLLKQSMTRARAMAYLPQNPEYSMYQRAFHCVLQGQYPLIKTELDKQTTIQQLFSTLAIEHLKDKRLGEMSGGERQRIFIARALAQESQVLLMDEPTNHLDFYQQVKLLQMLKALSQTRLILCVLHDLNLSLLYADQIILMKDLKIESMGNADHIIQGGKLKKCFGPTICAIQHPLYEDKYQVYYS